MVLGIDIGGTAIKSALVSASGIESKVVREPVSKADSQSQLLKSIEGVARESLQDVDGVQVIGVGVPGAVEEPEGLLTDVPNLRSLQGLRLRNLLEKSFGVPAFVDNSSNNAARGEHAFGAAKGARDFLMVTLGGGVGGGIVLGGDLFRGASGYAGEFGHMKIVPNGRRCGCGGYGCWEAYGNAPALVEGARALMLLGHETTIPKDGLDAVSILTAAQAGDQLALHALEEFARYSALGIANIVNVFNPSLCVIGGGLSQAGDLLLDRLRVHAMYNVLPRARRSLKLVRSSLGGEGGILGAAALALSGLRSESPQG